MSSSYCDITVPTCTDTDKSSWVTKRTDFTNTLNEITNTAVSSNSPYAAHSITIEAKIAQLNDLYNKIKAYLDGTCIQKSVLDRNTVLNTTILQLEQENDNKKDDVDSALARDEILRSRHTSVTPHQLFLLDRPIRRTTIPYLWILSVIFIGIALFIFKLTLPVIGVSDYNFIYILQSFFTNIYVVYSLLGATLIVVLFLSLKVAGVI